MVCHVKPIMTLIFIITTNLILIDIRTGCTQPLENNPFDDWVPVPECRSLCQGYYSELPPPFPGQSAVFLENQPITATADSAEFPEVGPTHLKGHVHLIQGNSQLFADKAILHRNPNKGGLDTAEAEGHVRLIEPGLRVDGTEGFLNKTEDKEIIDNASYRLYDRHGRGMAKRITVRSNTRMQLDDATYTTCAPYQNTWHLKAKRIRLNKTTGRGRALHAKLYVKGIPIFYAPYLDFPIDDRRQTGFLYPGFNYTNTSGFELSTPFYWNMAPNYDSTLTPRYLWKRGLEMNGLFRYLSRHSIGEVEGTILPNDKAYQNFQKEKLKKHPLFLDKDPRVLGLKGNANRTYLRLKHTTNFNPNWGTNIHYQKAGDDNYFADFGSTLDQAATTQLLQQGELLYRDPYWSNAIRFKQYQTLHPFIGPAAADIYRQIPQITLVNTYLDLPCGLQWGISSDLTRFKHKRDPFTWQPFTTGDRFQMRPSLSLPFIAPGWFVKPRIQWDFLGETLSLSPTLQKFQHTKKPTRTVPMFDIDSGLIFERTVNILKAPYIQTLEPRAYYLRVPFRDQNNLPIFDTSPSAFDYNQLYRDNRFAGLDRVGDANQLTLGVTTRFLTGKTGVERFSVSGGQIYYFEDRKVSTCNPKQFPECHKLENPDFNKHRSNFAATTRYQAQEAWSAIAGLEWNPYRKKYDKRSFNIQYRPHELDVLNLGFQHLRINPAQINPITGKPVPLYQTDVSFAWRLSEEWRILGRWHYDIKNHLSNTLLAGIEHQGCCTAVRLSVIRFLKPNFLFGNNLPTARTPSTPNAKNINIYNTGIQLQFVFKGFGSVGQKGIQSTLTSIPGYQWHDDRF